MHTQPSAIFCQITATTMLCLLLCGAAFAQQPSFVAFKTDLIEPPPIVSTPSTPQPQASEQHRFWDRNNCILFTAVTAFSAADFVVTRDNLQSGGRELNPVTRLVGKSTAGLAANFAGESAAVIGISYFFHKTGHHKMERAVSMLNAGSSAAAVSFDLAHR
jgi:hypothetical protein